MAYKSNIAVNPRVFYTLIGGDNSEAGTSLETAKSTIQGSIDAVNALVPPVNVLARAAIFIEGSGIFLENIILPEFTDYHARDITNTVSTGNLYTLHSSSNYKMGLSAVSTIAGVIFLIPNRTNVSLVCTAANVVGASASALLITGNSNAIFVNFEKLRLTGIASIGLNHAGTNTAEPEVFEVGSLTLEANDTIGVMYNVTANARADMDIGSISEVGINTGTVGIRVILGHLSVFCGEIIAGTALDVQAGTLAFMGTCVTGNINVAVGATLNCEITEFFGTINNLGTINGRIGNQIFGTGFVTTSDVLTNDVLVRGNGGVDIDLADHLTVPNNELNLQIALATDTGVIAIKDAGAVERIGISFNGTTGVATFSTPGGSVFDCGDGDSQAFQTWTSLGAANGSIFGWFVGDRNPLGNVVGNQSFYLRGDNANSNFYLKKNGLVDSAGWVPVITGPNTATVANKLMLWGSVDGSTALDNTIISYTPGVNNFLDFNHDDLNEISGLRWFTSAPAPGPTINFLEGTSQLALTNIGEILLFAPGITFDNRSLTLPTITRSLAASTVELFQWVRTGSNPADVSVFIASTAPAGGGDGDLAVRQATTNTDLFINVNGVWTGLLGAATGQTLAATLAAGNVTGGTDLSISNGDSIIAVGGETIDTVIKLNNLDALTTGGAISITSNSASTAARDLANIVNDDPNAINTTLLRLRNDAAGIGNANALDVVGRSFVNTGSLPIGEIGFGIACFSTTGAAFVFEVDADVSIDNGTTVANISQSHAVPTGTVALGVSNASTDTGSRAISSAGINQFTSVLTTGNGSFFDNDSITTGTGVRIRADSLGTGQALVVLSASVTANSRNLVDVINDEAAATGAINLHLQQDSTGPLLQLERSGGIVDLYADNITGDANITGNPGDVNFVDNLGDSDIEVNFGLVANSNRWGRCLGGPSTIMFGANSVASTTTLRFLFPGFADNTAQTADISMRMPRTGFLRNMHVAQNVAAGNGNDIVYTVHLNDPATLLAVTIASNVVEGQNTTDIVEVGPNDEISLRVTKALGIGSSPVDILVTIDYI